MTTMKYLLSTMLLITQSASGPGLAATGDRPDSGRIAAVLESLKQGVNAHSFSMVEPSLAVGFSYQGKAGEFGRMIMSQVVTGCQPQFFTLTPALPEILQPVFFLTGKWTVNEPVFVPLCAQYGNLAATGFEITMAADPAFVVPQDGPGGIRAEYTFIALTQLPDTSFPGQRRKRTPVPAR
jgi:hypothetical protein